MKNLFDCPHNYERTRFMAHRGFTPEAPENSLPAFEAAGKKGYWAIETDVHKTADGVLVCCHNSSTKKMYNEALVIEETSFAELRRLYIAVGNNADTIDREQLVIPTFAQYIAICKKYGCVPFIETKGAVVGDVLKYVEEEGMTETSVLSSAKFEHIEEARELSEKIFIHHIFSDEEHLERLSVLGNAGLSYNIVDFSLIPDGIIEHTHDMGVKMCLRAGDTVERARAMLDMGLDYIPTNCIYSLI